MPFTCKYYATAPPTKNTGVLTVRLLLATNLQKAARTPRKLVANFLQLHRRSKKHSHEHFVPRTPLANFLHLPARTPRPATRAALPLLILVPLLASGAFPLSAFASTKVIFLTTTGAGTWTVPSDWNSTNNTIEVLGGGQGGGYGGGNGGNGGGYSKVLNVALTPGNSVTFQLAAGGAGDTGSGPGAGGDTYFCNSTSNCTDDTWSGGWGSAVVAATLGGGNGASVAVGYYPYALAFDSSGNLYTANYGGNTVSKITSGGTVTTTWATVGTEPYALAFDASGNLYTANYGSGTVSKITSGGTVSTFATVGSYPAALALDSSGNLYVANDGSHTVSKITSGGTVSTFASGLSGPIALAFDSSGNLYTANAGSGTVSKITSGGTVTTFASGLNYPAALAFDSSGNLYIANNGSGTVSKVTPGGTVTTFATVGSNPNALAFDSSGNLYVANYGSNTVSKVTPGGTVTTFTAVGAPGPPPSPLMPQGTSTSPTRAVIPSPRFPPGA